MTGGAGVVAHYVLFSSFYFCSLLLWSVADGVIANDDVLFLFFFPRFLERGRRCWSCSRHGPLVQGERGAEDRGVGRRGTGTEGRRGSEGARGCGMRGN